MNKTTRLLILMLASTIAFSDSVVADEIDDIVILEMQKRGIPGLSLALVMDGKIIKTAGYGFADLKTKKTVDADTVFQLASVTKQFVAAGIMLLVEDGRLDLDDSIRTHLKLDLPPTWNEIKIRHLLSHSSGIPDYLSQNINVTTDANESAIKLARTVSRQKLKFQPGDKYQYSNTNYLLLGQIIRVKSGKDYGDFLENKLFGRLKMGATKLRVPGAPKLAVGYSRRLPDQTPARELNPTRWDHADGGLVSSANDMAKWAQAIQKKSVLSKVSFDAMTSRTKLNKGKFSNYGFGLIINQFPTLKVVGHSGGRPGVHTNFTTWYRPKHIVSVAILCNVSLSGQPGFEIGSEIVKTQIRD